MPCGIPINRFCLFKDVDVSLKQKAENPEVGEEERKLAKEEYEAQELKARRRLLLLIIVV